MGDAVVANDVVPAAVGGHQIHGGGAVRPGRPVVGIGRWARGVVLASADHAVFEQRVRGRVQPDAGAAFRPVQAAAQHFQFETAYGDVAGAYDGDAHLHGGGAQVGEG